MSETLNCGQPADGDDFRVEGIVRQGRQTPFDLFFCDGSSHQVGGAVRTGGIKINDHIVDGLR